MTDAIWKMASWSVRVRPIRDTSGDRYRYFGDVDEAKGNVLPFAKAALRNASELDDQERAVIAFKKFAPAREEQGEVAAWLDLTTYGIPGDIRETGTTVFRRRPEHGDAVDQLALFQLPPGWTEGLLTICARRTAVAKNAIQHAFKAALRDHGLFPEVLPVIRSEMIKAAIAENRIRRVTYLSSKPQAEQFGDLSDFGEEAEIGSVRTTITPTRRQRFLLGRRFQGILDNTATPGLVRFNDTDYDQVRLTVELATGQERTITLGDDLRAAHPIWIDLPDLPAEPDDEFVSRVAARLSEQAAEGWPL